MMKRELWRVTLLVLRTAIVLTIIVALGFSGATAAERAFEESTKPEAVKPVTQSELAPLPSPDEPIGQMAKGPGPSSEQSATLHAPVGLSCEKEVRYRGVLDLSSTTDRLTVAPAEAIAPLQSTACVSSRLAAQQTLVGAKPSGTM